VEQAKEESKRSARSKKKDEDVDEFTLPTKPGELEQRLRELEKTFLALEGALDDARHQELWPEMARLNAALGQRDETAICWGHALWEGDNPPAAWLGAWFQTERRSPEELSAAPLRTLLARSMPSGPELRSLVILLLASGPESVELRPLLGEVQKYLEKHEDLLGIRLAWLAWQALHGLAHGDVLALARARDRLLERLYQTGLSAELDLPGFVRFTGRAASDRFRLVREQLLRLRTMVQQWLGKGTLVGPGSFMYSDLIFAYGLARLGDATNSQQLLREADKRLRERDFVHDWLYQAYEFRIRQALEGKAHAGRLSQEMLESLAEHDRVDETGLDVGTLKDLKDKLRLERYKIDRLLEHARILEPHEKISAYRHWHSRFADELDRELAALSDLTDHSTLAERLRKLLTTPKGKPRPPVPRVLAAALELAPRLGESFAADVLERVELALEKLPELLDQALLLEKALFLAGHFDKREFVQRLLVRLHLLLEEGGATWPVDKLESLLGHTFRSLRKLGLSDEVGHLLQRLSALIQQDSALTSASPGMALRLLLQVAGGWFYFGQNDRARPVLDQARSLLMQGKLFHTEQTALACAYVATLGQGPLDLALARITELLRKVKGVQDTYTVNSHYSLSRLDLVEAVVLALVGEDFTVAPEARRWLDDDEYLVRRRIHRDMRAALEQSP
jgi:hypothetical protein